MRIYQTKSIFWQGSGGGPAILPPFDRHRCSRSLTTYSSCHNPTSGYYCFFCLSSNWWYDMLDVPQFPPLPYTSSRPLHTHVVIAATFMCDSTPRLRRPLLYNPHLLPPYIGYTVYRAHHAPSTSLQVSLLPDITQPDIRSQSHTSTMRWRICDSHLNCHHYNPKLH